jgi:glycosyltransferase involved in cell wall biosynthesis
MFWLLKKEGEHYIIQVKRMIIRSRIVIRRIKQKYKDAGLFEIIKSIYKFAKWKSISFLCKFIPNKIGVDRIIESSKCKRIIIFENYFGFSTILTQRPQHISTFLAKDDTLFIYGSIRDEDYTDKTRTKKINNNFYIMDLEYYRNTLMKEFKKHDVPGYVMFYSTDKVKLSRLKKYEKKGFEFIYEYVDEINPDLLSEHVTKKARKRHDYVVNKGNYIIATADKLYENVMKQNDSALILLSNNAVDYDHFNNYEKTKINKEMTDIVNRKKPIIGYYGALATWFDYSYILELANTRPDYEIVLFGIKFDNSYDNSVLDKCENVHFLGKLDYQELPDYAGNIDVLTIPFVINEITESTSPVKLFEYMALGKPIVTSDLPECRKYKSALIAETKEDFVKCIDDALEKIRTNDNNYFDILEKEALENTWAKRAEAILELLNEGEIKHDVAGSVGLRHKAIKIWKTEGITGFAKKAFRFIKMNTLSKIAILDKVRAIVKRNKYKSEIKQILSNNSYNRIVVWRSRFGWNVPLFQRPQHIANYLSDENTLYIYEVTKLTDSVNSSDRIKDNLYKVNFHNISFSKMLLDEIEKTEVPRYLHFYSTEYDMSVSQLKGYIIKGYRILYEYIDDLSPVLAGTADLPMNVKEKYKFVMENDKNALVVVTADDLLKDAISKRGENKVFYACNGVNYNHFANPDSNIKVSKEFQKIIDMNKPIIGYYGALASWFDYDLIKYIADQRPDYQIVLFGILYCETYNKQQMDKYNNIHFLGAVDNEILPSYSGYFDVCTIPFVLNEITQATSPLKLFEYMALGKPTITTNMKVCRKYMSVMIGHDYEEFLSLIDKGLKMNKKDNKEYFELLEKEALENTWESKAKTIIEFIKEDESDRDQYHVKTESDIYNIA